MAERETFTGLRLRERYRIGKPLGQGALCTVYEGADEHLTRRMLAIKAVPPEQVAAYRAALRATSALTHPAGVIVLDAIEHEEWLFLVQEHVASEPLSAQIEAGLATQRALDVGLQLARFLAYAHRHDMIHGDITPAAVLVEPGRLVRLNNFGLPPDTAYFERHAEVDDLLVRMLDMELGPADEEQADEEHEEEQEDEHGEQREAAQTAPTAAGDVRALGLLLWQALATAGPSGERKDFRADVPADLRTLVARTVVRGHPYGLTTADTLCAALEVLAREAGLEALEEELPPPPPLPRPTRQLSMGPEPGLAGSRRPSMPSLPSSTFFDAPTWGAGGQPDSAPGADLIPGSAGAAAPFTGFASSGAWAPAPWQLGGDPGTALPQTGRPTGPLRAPSTSGPLRARLSGPLPTGGPASGPLRASPSGSLRGGLAPSSQPGAYRPAAPIPWSDDPQVARWAAERRSRPSGPWASRGQGETARDTARGWNVTQVVVLGIVLFILFFVLGYFLPLVLPLR